jgi:hypothetical protein
MVANEGSRGYLTEAIIASAKSAGMNPCLRSKMRPRRNRYGQLTRPGKSRCPGVEITALVPFSTATRYFNSNRPGRERLTENPQSPSACFDEWLTVLTVATGNDAATLGKSLMLQLSAVHPPRDGPLRNQTATRWYEGAVYGRDARCKIGSDTRG